ncbi:endoplasmic reticulum Oxidoreductin 1-domain-containing protein [Mortierella sp. GBAus27b]|nr:endoplasmic reticulum Oxidoreductin 1-domain-containing protein [Mortierella sp. GBAus27b]
MQIENSLCDYDTVETINQELRAQLSSLLNLYGTCPFWTENHLCTNRDCGVAVIDEGRIPEEWTSASLGAISSPSNGMMFQPFKRCQLKDQDFCQVEDEALSEGVYVDLMENPERFTGYSGPSAARVWDAIYNENCFNVAQKMQMESKCEQCSLDRQANEELLARDLKAVARNGLSMAKNPLAATRIAPNQSPDEAAKVPHAAASSFDHTSPSGSPTQPLGSLTTGQEEVCLEKRVFYRMISGLHASISIHICDEYFNQTSGTWGPNLECFVSRVGTHPDRLENIYFDYAILVRAVTKLSGYLKHYEFCTGNPQEDAKVKAMVDRLIETSAKSPAVFDEKAMFVGPGAQALKMEFRDHFRNISKIMDCVGCEKCRLWGKVQTSGLGTALKVLFSYNDEHLNPIKNPNLLQRTEIVALFNAFNRLSESVESITKFRELYMQQYGQHWMAATSPDPSEPMQHPETKDHKMEQAGRLAKEEKENSPGIWPLFLSALEKCPGCRVASSERPLFLANMLPTNINHVLQDTRAWIVATGSVVRDLILDLYHHPVLLFRGEQTRTRIQSTGEDAGVSI